MSRASKLAEALLRDRARARAGRKAVRTTTKTERVNFDPFAITRWRVIPDKHWPGMYRLRLPDGSLTDMVNLTRARDALAELRGGND
jgi:hypothetical protein